MASRSGSSTMSSQEPCTRSAPAARANASVSLTRFGGHRSKGGYGVDHGRGEEAEAATAELHRGLQGRSGTAGARRGQDRAHQRGARRAGAAAQGGSRAADGAGDPKKSGLLRERAPLRFGFIDA